MLRGPTELATLQVQAPEKPAVVEYGRILVEATIRREVAAMGLRLELLAADQPEQIIDGVADALASLNGLDQRRRVSMGHHPELDSELRIASRPLAAETTSPTKGSTNVNTAVVGDLINHHLADAEKAVIGAAVHDWPPRARARVLGRIRLRDSTVMPCGGRPHRPTLPLTCSPSREAARDVRDRCASGRLTRPGC